MPVLIYKLFYNKQSTPPVSNKSGFTLIELLVVIALISLVLAITAGSIAVIQKNTRDAKRQSDLREIQSALQYFYSDNNFYPSSIPASGQPVDSCTSIPSCSMSNSKTYLKQVPPDPSGGDYIYRSLVSPSSTQTCNYTSSATPRCHYYVLCAKSENSGKSSTLCSSISPGYNLEVTP